MLNKLSTGATGLQGGRQEHNLHKYQNRKSQKITISGVVLSKIPTAQQTSSMAEVSFSSLYIYASKASASMIYFPKH